MTVLNSILVFLVFRWVWLFHGWHDSGCGPGCVLPPKGLHLSIELKKIYMGLRLSLHEREKGGGRERGGVKKSFLLVFHS